VTGERRALIVAAERYEHEGLRRLPSAAADAEALGRVLGDPGIGEFDVDVVRDEPAHVVAAAIEELFAAGRPDDVLLLHFSGHGLKNEAGELYFAARNTRPDRLASTAVAADLVQRCMRASRSRSIVLLLDCCYGAAFGRGVAVRAAGDAHVLDSFPGDRLAGGRGRAVITASSSMEYAFEGERLADSGARPSVFTAALVDGLSTGDADRDQDGWVSLSELYDYVFDRVRERNPHQTPSRDVEMEGEFYLARSRRRRVRAQPIPADLRAAMTEANMFSRLGATTELRARLLGDNVAAAAGAYEALAEMATGDIRYVAETATAAMAEVAVRVEPTDLRFGRIEVGAESPPRRLSLAGPPLARAVTVRASEGWIRVADEDDGFRVSVRPDRAGVRRGLLTLIGPSGEAAVSVEVEAVDPVPDTREAGVDPATAIGRPADVGDATGAGDATAAAAGAAPADGGSGGPLAPGGSGGPADGGSAAPPAGDATAPARVPPAAARARSRVGWPLVAAATVTASGVAFVVAALVGFAATEDLTRLRAGAVVLSLYAVSWALLTVADRDRPVAGRIATGLIAALALLPAIFLVSSGSVYFQYWSIQDSPLVWFYLVAGPLEVAAAVSGGRRPARVPEIVSGVLAALLGVAILLAVNRSVEGVVPAAFGGYALLAGLTWTVAGILRRRSVARPSG
jgi:hypothetical protein